MPWVVELISSFGLVLGFFWLGLGFGQRLRKYVGLTLASPVVLVLAIGWGVIGYLIYFLGLIHLLRPTIIYVVLAAIALFSFNELKNIPIKILTYLRSIKPPYDFLTIGMILLIGFFLTLYFIAAFAPDIKFDSLWYHLTEAKTYLLEGRIRPFLPPAQLGQSSVTPRLIEMLYTAVLAFNQATAVSAKLIHFLFGAGAVIGIYELGQSVFNRRTGLIAAVGLVSVPVVSWLVQTAYIDLGVLFYGVATLIAYEKWRKNPATIVFPIVFGFFLATKLWVVLFIPVLLADALLARVPLKKLLAGFGLPLLIASPWFIEATLATGNPVYPVFSGPTDLQHLGGAVSISDWFMRVYWQLFYPTLIRVSVNLIPWLPGVLLILLYPKKVTKDTWRWLLLGLALVLAWSIIPVRDERYLIVFVVPLILVVARLYDVLLDSFWPAVGVTLPSIVLLGFLLIAPIQRTTFYWPVVSGQISKPDFLYENIAKNIWNCYDETPAIQTIRSDPSANKLLVFCHNLFYLHPPYEDGFDVIPKIKVNDPDDLIFQLKAKGFTHVYTKAPAYSLANIFQSANLAVPSPNWLAEHFTLLTTSQIDNVSIYAIN